jgi:SAM-dependent methyltransferase
VLDLGKHPLCDDLVPISSDRVCKEYPIEILYCNNCYTAHQHYQVPKHDLFTKDYHYRARMTGSVLSGMSDLVESCYDRLGDLRDKLVLDIGCNDGSLLDLFQTKNCRTIGIEPTGAAKDSKHKTLNTFFDKETAEQVLGMVGTPDIITFTNVFAHIEDLSKLQSNLKLLMGPDTVVVIENHYLGAILEYGQFDTFYHEHPRTYSHRSFEVIGNNLGVNILDVQYVSRYGGNIRVYLGRGDKNLGKFIDESKFMDKFIKMKDDLVAWKESTITWIEKYVNEYGKIRAKAFPGRAAILIKLLGLDEKSISAVYEIKGSFKVGHYVPGTRIPILPEAELYKKNKTKPILNLAWHIPAEVRANLAANGYTGKVIDIKSWNNK